MKTIITTAFAILISSMAFAQLKKADRHFDKWEYNEAAKLYDEAAKKNPSADVYYKLGQCYQKMFRFQDAAVAYDKVNAYGSYSHSDFYLNYGLVLKANGRYTEAKDAFVKYDNLNPGDPRGKFYASSCDVVLDDLQKPVPVTVTDLPFNTSDAAFSPAMYDGGIVYASNSAAATGTKTFPWTGKSYLDLFYAKRGSSDTDFGGTGTFSSDEVNQEYHDGPASFTKNYDTIYFNRVSRELKGEKKRTLGVERSKIYYSVLKDGKWSEEKPFAFNNDSFGVFTPFVSRDGSHLYFASDMPGGYGETDIYYCLKQSDGTWGKPINLGPTVNTFGREQFPSLDSTGNLYFASDGYKGYGGLDICVSKFSGGSFQPSEVLKAPLNSSDNDYGIAFLKNEKSGYLSSARSDGKGDADIYYFNLERDSIPCDINTTMYVIGYECVKKIPVAEVHHDTIPPVAEVIPSVMHIRPIYFDFDKSDIRADAINSIDSVAQVMRDHPDWKLQLSGHADCRGSNEYNLALSQRRAASALKYLSGKGINTSRITTQGFGETQLVNHCSDGVPCSEAEHQLNRRVEFTVTFEKKEVSQK